jgi:hypothetical protein
MSDQQPTPIRKKMLYAAVACVRVEIYHPDNSRGRLHDDGGFIRRFMAFCEGRGYVVLRGTMTVGPGIYSADLASNGLSIPDMLYDVEDWLVGNGAELDMRTS